MTDKHTDGEWSELRDAAQSRVDRSRGGGHAPTAIDAAMARGTFDLVSGRLLVSFGSTPPPTRPSRRASPEDVEKGFKG